MEKPHTIIVDIEYKELVGTMYILHTESIKVLIPYSLQGSYKTKVDEIFLNFKSEYARDNKQITKFKVRMGSCKPFRNSSELALQYC